MKFLLGLIVLMLLLGCSEYVDKWEVDVLTDACANHKGIMSISTFMNKNAQCMDGTFTESTVALRKKL